MLGGDQFVVHCEFLFEDLHKLVNLGHNVHGRLLSHLCKNLQVKHNNLLCSINKAILHTVLHKLENTVTGRGSHLKDSLKQLEGGTTNRNTFIILLGEGTDINLLNQLLSDWDLSKREVLHITEHLVHKHEVSVDDCDQALKRVLLDLGVGLFAQLNQIYSDCLEELGSLLVDLLSAVLDRFGDGGLLSSIALLKGSLHCANQVLRVCGEEASQRLSHDASNRFFLVH